uniref:L antigen family member 3 n=1 Tax=Myotis myotis TaxID=51298 RepID=A0A7J7YDK4_MYOMY|nr:hypothetical protein mMyoMyo1_010961 [Myotis myotis]
MEDDDGIPGRGAEDGEGQAIPGDPGIPDRPGGHEGPGRGGSGEAGAEGGPAQGAQALNAPGPDGIALPGPMAINPRPEPLQFSFIVPFRSPVEAEIAWEYLAQRPQPQPVVVEQELAVSDNLLSIRLSSEDPAQLLTTFITFLHELTLLIQTMQRLLPPYFFLTPRPEKGG